MLDGLEEVMTKILLVILIICFGYIFSRIIEYIFYNKHNKDFQLSYSTGYAYSGEHKGATLVELLHLADEAMYANKKAFKAKRK